MKTMDNTPKAARPECECPGVTERRVAGVWHLSKCPLFSDNLRIPDRTPTTDGETMRERAKGFATEHGFGPAPDGLDMMADFAQSEVARTLDKLREEVDRAWWENTKRARHTTKVEVLAIVKRHGGE